MDADIEELREELRIQRKLLEDTNNTVHKMHRHAVWGRVMSLLWWGAIVLLTGSVYYYFFLPYLSQVLELYGDFQSGVGQTQDFWSQASELLNQYR